MPTLVRGLLWWTHKFRLRSAIVRHVCTLFSFLFRTTWNHRQFWMASFGNRRIIKGAHSRWWKSWPIQCPGKFFGHNQSKSDPSVSNSNRFTCCDLSVFLSLFELSCIANTPRKRSVIFLKSWTSTGSSSTSGRISMFIAPILCSCFTISEQNKSRQKTRALPRRILWSHHTYTSSCVCYFKVKIDKLQVSSVYSTCACFHLKLG